MSTKKNFSGAWIIKNLFLAAVVVCAILLGVNIGLNAFTDHNKTVEVPDFVGFSPQDATRIASESGLNLVVTDSVYVNRFKLGAVYSQMPKAGSKVKKGRKIYLTLNSTKKKQVGMPSLVGLSVRQAKVELQSRALELGKLNYVSDIATNNVLAQSVNGVEVLPGKKIDIGTIVDLKVGLNYSDPYTIIPSFIRLPFHSAINAVQDSYLNVAAIVFDSTVRSYSDSLAAVVYKQIPAASAEKVIMGRGVKLYFTLDENKIPVQEMLDSLSVNTSF